MPRKKRNNTIKLVVGILISAVFLYLAFGKIDLDRMAVAFQSANFWLFIPATVMIFLSHWLRAYRWQYFLASMGKIPVRKLYSATLIGYMGNTVLPAHLGEVFRANVIGKSEKIPTSSVLATIVIERIVDVLTLLLVMLIAVFTYPFPQWVARSGYIMFAVVAALFLFLFLLKRQHPATLKLMTFGLSLLPQTLAAKIQELITAFISGINGVKRKRDYLPLFMLSILIWACYWGIFHILFYAFNMVEGYQLTVVSSIVLLVITTISVVVPSSPGYIGTYHYLCQLSLALFGVPESLGLSYAIMAHGISIFPVALVGFLLAWKEGINRISEEVPATTAST